MSAPHEDDEDRIVEAWAGRDDADGLLAAVRAAIAGGRWRLAARLVSLTDPEPGEAPEIGRARRMAGLLVVEGGPDALARWQDAASALSDVSRRLVLRSRRRQRDAVREAGRLDRRGRGR